jgi:hypothetical protein
VVPALGNRSACWQWSLCRRLPARSSCYLCPEIVREQKQKPQPWDVAGAKFAIPIGHPQGRGALVFRPNAERESNENPGQWVS